MAGNRKPRHKRSTESKQWRDTMKPKHPNYNGNARFIEIGASDAPFRNFINVDHIVAIRFEQALREVDVQIKPGILAKPLDLVKGLPAVDAVPPVTQKQVKPVGWQILIANTNGQNNAIEFAELQPAMRLYNSIIKQINALLVPNCALAPLAMPEAANDNDESVAKTNGDKIVAVMGEPDDLEDLSFLTEEELHALDYPVKEDGSPLTDLDELDPDPDKVN